MNTDEILGLLASSLRNRADTFASQNGYIDCELGGAFTPACEEMAALAEAGSAPPAGAVKLTDRQAIEYSAVPARLFYEVLKRDTNFDFIELRLRAAGAMECSIIAQNETGEQLVQSRIVNFGPEPRTLALPFIDLISLPKNGSLYLKLRSTGPSCYAHGFRWVGKIPAAMANTGERVIVLKASAQGAETIAKLNRLAEALGSSHPEILKRTLFLLHDWSPALPAALENCADNLRLVILSGPPRYAGRNASLPLSLILEAARAQPGSISEVLVLDDEARFDPETLLRHDSFITGRKQNVISTAILHSASAPPTILLYSPNGGIQERAGKMRSGAQGQEKRPLPDSQGKITPSNMTAWLAAYRAPATAPFVFISFPCQLLEKCGAPLPLFMYNEDTEFCGRCLQKGARLVVNPNLHVWADIPISPLSEFYGLLHGLILAFSQAELSPGKFYLELLNKLGKTAANGDYALLRMWDLALQKIAQGPAWLETRALFDEYRAMNEQVRQIMADFYSLLPAGKFAELSGGRLQETGSLKNAPDSNNGFYCPARVYNYGINDKKADQAILAALMLAIGQLQKIGHSLDRLQQSDWRNCLASFDAPGFWASQLDAPESGLDFQATDCHETVKPSAPPDRPVPDAEAEARKALFARLPEGFTLQGYLDANPDIRAAGMDPVGHWFKYGQFENRKF